jgi:hypothetical protein
VASDRGNHGTSASEAIQVLEKAAQTLRGGDLTAEHIAKEMIEQFGIRDKCTGVELETWDATMEYGITLLDSFQEDVYDLQEAKADISARLDGFYQGYMKAKAPKVQQIRISRDGSKGLPDHH